MSPEVMAAYLVAVIAIAVTPGPDLTFIVASGAGYGPRAGVAAAFGMSAGMLVHTALAALGMATVLEAIPAAADTIRLVGAGYLLYVAADTIRLSRGSGVELAGIASRTVFRRAFVTNLSNPKIIVFFAAFLPTFVRPDQGPVAGQLALLGLVFLLVGLVIDTVVGLLAGRLRNVVATGGRLSHALGVGSGLALAVIAVILMVEVAAG